MKITVYCGSSIGKDPAWAEAAERLGCWIGEHGHSLVYGGGDAGLMGIISRCVFEKGGHVIGVIPENVSFIAEREQPYVSEVIRTADMSTRKKTMLELGDAFIALPGGIGTLDEITEAMTLVRIGIYRKPCVLFNENNYYGPFRDLLEQMIGTGFMNEKDREWYLFSSDPDEIAAFLNRGL